MGEFVLQAAKGLHYLMEVVSEWRQKYPQDKRGDIVFQHKPTLANVVFTNNALHKIQAHSTGFEQIPETIENPDELWSLWEDPAEQKVVIRYYMKFGKVAYMVKTRDGVIQDAFAMSLRAINKYRKGCLL